MCRRPAHHQHHLHHARSAQRPPGAGAPSTATDPDLRVGDREREQTMAALREHAAAGRLTVAELEERVDAALAARTGRDLQATLADLPDLAVAPGRAAHPAPRAARPEPLAAVVGPWLAVSLALVLVWALSGAGAFWPIWPIAGWGIAVALRVLAAVTARGRRAPGPRVRSRGVPVP